MKLSRNSELPCPVLVENDTTHIAKLPTGRTCFIETRITSVKISRYRFFGLNTLVYSAVHTHYLATTEPINVHCQDKIQTNNFFELNHNDLYKYLRTNKNICNA